MRWSRDQDRRPVAQDSIYMIAYTAPSQEGAAHLWGGRRVKADADAPPLRAALLPGSGARLRKAAEHVRIALHCSTRTSALTSTRPQRAATRHLHASNSHCQLEHQPMQALQCPGMDSEASRHSNELQALVGMQHLGSATLPQ